MPCTYYLPGEQEAMENSRLRKELDHATKLLCYLTSIIPSKYTMDPEVQEWINKHKAMDEERKRAKKAAAEFAKLAKKREIAELEARLKKLKGG